MRLLLDTQALIWWVLDDPRLGPRARGLIADRRSTVLVSIASFWEISIKHRIGKLAECGSVLLAEARASSFEILEINGDHLGMLEKFESRPDHKDPFDLLILVQAIASDAILVTADRKMRSYDLRCL
jgi:PIN domain nuclease of toxin-antitoxin system